MKKILLVTVAALSLAGCETMNSVTKGIDDAVSSVNQAIGAGPIADTPEQICSEIRSNQARATNKYVGKTVEATGKITLIEQNVLAQAMGTVPGWGGTKQFNVRVTSGQTVFVSLISKRASKLDAFNLGDAVTIRGRVENLEDGNKACYAYLAENMSITKN